ncbi:hypothetical protein H0H81_005174 [Sphagnurus paluster]|uniref:Uncharacterized protein n=1 Tax=Sphagnurus paluster TaxID=117069 RepID=A0A9P7KH23_9AGAR|nr:hypothetical protein H0H81_005174 [Sphagnurus paluster]
METTKASSKGGGKGAAETKQQMRSSNKSTWFSTTTAAAYTHNMSPASSIQPTDPPEASIMREAYSYQEQSYHLNSLHSSSTLTSLSTPMNEMIFGAVSNELLNQNQGQKMSAKSNNLPPNGSVERT